LEIAQTEEDILTIFLMKRRKGADARMILNAMDRDGVQLGGGVKELQDHLKTPTI